MHKMKRSLFVKFLICYILVAISMFTLLNTYGVNRLEHGLVEGKKTVLYNEASLISSEYMTRYYNGTMSLFNLSSQLKTIDTFLNARIWIVDRPGNIILDTRSVKSESNSTNILDIDETFLDNVFSEHNTFGKLIREPVLSIVLPVSSDFKVKGYIVIHAALSAVKNDSVYFMNFINMCFLFFLALMLVVFMYIYYITVRPIKKITKATKEYTSGHFDYPLVLNTSDEYKDLSDAIVYMADELNSLDDYQKNFVANISHDFRSPLTSIKGYAEAILDGTIPTQVQGKYLDIIVFETERLTKLTANLLELNNFENNGTLLDIVTFDVNSVIKKTAESFEGICTKKKIAFNLMFSNKVIYVDADISKIQQVLYNLIDNAVKFSNPNSKITLSVEEKNDKIFISVKDYGVGISKESIKRIWERFYKSDSSRGKDKLGTGLGLSIVKEIINAHNENINVISTQRVGTEFIFSLSKAQE